MRNIEGRITLLVDKDGASLEIECHTSGIKIANIKISPDDFCALLARHAYKSCSIEIPDKHYWQNVGKKQVMDNISFPMPDGVPYQERKQIACDLLPAYTPEGWIADTYFGSQGSFSRKDGKDYANTIIRSWVDVEAENGD